MTLLEHKIIERIKKQGPITFETFMDMALYYPGLGYYTSPEFVIGRKGDFYTSSHLHAIFGMIIGKQLEEMWEIMGKPSNFSAVEIGAGRGYLCKDMLEYLKNRHIFRSLNYIIAELNPVLRENQRNLLSDFSNKIKWVSSVNELHVIRGCIYSNELLDAFPVHLVEKEDTLKEIFISFNENYFIEQYQDVSSLDIINYLKQFSIRMPRGYRTEINLRIKDWLRDIAEALTDGFLLTVDYGYTAQEYYEEDRTKGTLLCYHKHQVTENPYENIGKQDVTAHVNFSSLKRWGNEIGFKTIGYCPQGTFLIALGIDELITELYGDSPDYEAQILKIKGLLLPQGMGESHKVMIQYKGEGMPELRGFSLRNNVRHL
jgi:SAM-dependent MidA family methyltransferase